MIGRAPKSGGAPQSSEQITWIDYGGGISADGKLGEVY
jgi:hypothetical protein